MPIDLKLAGTITAQTPITITRPDPKDGPKDPFKGTPMLTVISHGTSDPRPYIPGETLKGRFRSLSSDIVRSVTAQPLTHDMFWQLYKGGIKNDDKEPPADLKKIVEFRNSNPVFGLYGAAVPRWLGGSLSMEHAIPRVASDVGVQSDNYMRIDDFKTFPERTSGLPDETVAEYLAYDAGKKERTALAEQKQKLTAEISRLLKQKPKPQARIDELDAERADLDRQAKEISVGNTIGRPLDARRAIAIGSRFAHQIRVIAGTDAEVGLLLATMQELSRNCRIGGHRSVGHGYFRAEYSVLVREGVGQDYQDAGSLVVGPDEFALTSDHATIERATAAWAAKVADPTSLMLKVA